MAILPRKPFSHKHLVVFCGGLVFVSWNYTISITPHCALIIWSPPRGGFHLLIQFYYQQKLFLFLSTRRQLPDTVLRAPKTTNYIYFILATTSIRKGVSVVNFIYIQEPVGRTSKRTRRPE